MKKIKSTGKGIMELIESDGIQTTYTAGDLTVKDVGEIFKAPLTASDSTVWYHTISEKELENIVKEAFAPIWDDTYFTSYSTSTGIGWTRRTYKIKKYREQLASQIISKQEMIEDIWRKDLNLVPLDQEEDQDLTQNQKVD